MKKLIIISIGLSFLFGFYLYINQEKNEPEVVVFIEEHNNLALKENKANLAAPKPLEYVLPKNYLETSGNWKSK